ncbi:MAG: cytochrome c oxidase subunit II [Acetobacteraceae bacterium]|nr:cytochrome c oxidase subunit II [Acetobacteraceae bacterium]
MSDSAAPPGFEEAFHQAAERHERVWVFIAIVLLSLLMAGTLFFVVLDYGVVVQTDGYRADPASVATTPPFADAALVRTGPNAYAVHMLAHLWTWTPSPLHVPQGAAITFYVTSSDVLHGFEVQGTTINVTAVPGIVGSVTYTFAHPGTYYIICNEFCGIEHQAMIGRIIVDPARPA